MNYIRNVGEDLQVLDRNNLKKDFYTLDSISANRI